MQMLYKAYGCEIVQGGKFLLPGYPIENSSEKVPAVEKIKVELADGTFLETTVLETKLFILEQSVMEQLKVRAKPGMYYAIQVPDEFSPTAITLGVKVYLDN